MLIGAVSSDDITNSRLQGDAVAAAISGLKLDQNKITMKLSTPFEDEGSSSSSSSSDDETEETEADQPGRKGGKGRAKGKRPGKKPKKQTVSVDVDLSLTAYANARVQYDTKKSSATKEKKTIEASGMALANAEKKTATALKGLAVNATMQKARKTYWFEKFLWFISSENYLVVGGRDRQQNEQIVRRYLTKGDIYVHADFHGASSCVIKNPSGVEVPPRTLSEVFLTLALILTMSHAFLALFHPTHAVRCALLSAHVHWLLIGVA